MAGGLRSVRSVREALATGRWPGEAHATGEGEGGEDDDDGDGDDSEGCEGGDSEGCENRDRGGVGAEAGAVFRAAVDGAGSVGKAGRPVCAPAQGLVLERVFLDRDEMRRFADDATTRGLI